MGGLGLVDQQLTKSYKWYKKLFLRLVMQCTLAAHTLYKKQGGKDDFLFFLSSRCMHNTFQKAPRFKRNPSRVAIYNIARLTRSNHWPVKRETPEEWKAMKSTTKRCRVCLAKEDSKEWKTHKNNLGLQGMPKETCTLCGKRMF